MLRASRGRSRRLLAFGLSVTMAISLGEAVSLASSSTSSQASADASTGTGGQFVPVQGRILDTRTASSIGGYSSPMTAGQWRKIQVGGVAGVPTTGVSAVAVTFSVINQQAAGYLRADKDQTTPNATVTYMNYTAAGAQSNSGTLAVATNGKIQVQTVSATDLIIDVQGYYTADATVAPGGYVPVAPQRLVDTRNGIGVTQAKLAGGSATSLNIAALAGLPSGASGAMLNFTVANYTATGSKFFYAYPADGVRPNAGFNFTTNVTDATMAQIGLSTTSGSAGALKFELPGTGYTVDLIVDIVGYFAAGQSGGTFTPAAARVWDSRTSGHVKIASGGTVTVPIVGSNGIPASGVSSVVTDLTAISSSGNNGYLALYASGITRPTPFSSVAYIAGGAYANMATSEVGDDGAVVVYNSGPDAVDFVLDVEGWYSPEYDADAEADLPEVPSDPSAGEVGATPAPPSGTFGGVVQNARGIAQAGLNVQISDSVGEPDTQPGSTGYEDPALGNTTTDADGKWTFTLPSPLPALLRDEAAGNGGVLNLNVDVTGYSSSDGTPFFGQTTASVAVMAPPEDDASASRSASTQALAGDGQGSSELVDGTLVDAQDQTVTTMHVAGSVDVDVSSQEVEDTAPATTGTGGPIGTTSSGNGPLSTDRVGSRDYTSDSLSATPVPKTTTTATTNGDGTQSSSSSSYKTDCSDPSSGTGKQRIFRTVSHKDGVAYTIVGEAHAYWDAHAWYRTEHKVTYTSTIGLSVDNANFGTSATISKSTNVGTSASLGLSAPDYAHLVRQPYNYRNKKQRQSCDLLKKVDGSWRFVRAVDHYRYRVESLGYKIDSKHAPVVWSSAVPGHDGHDEYVKARWNTFITPGSSFFWTQGYANSYERAVNAFGYFVKFQASVKYNSESQNYQAITAGRGKQRRHYIFQSHCNFNASRCSNTTFYSW